MRKEDKGAIIDQLGEVLDQYDHFYVTDAAGMNAEDTAALRRSCFEKEIKLMVVKNTLLKKALEKKGEEYAPLFDSLKGNSAVMFTSVGNAPAKLIKEFAKKSKAGKPVLKSAFVEQSVYVGENQLDTLVSIKSKNELIADVIALLQSPAKNVISALQSGGNTITGVLKTLSNK
ncbi:MAG: 50S ribosomal protein L10 [Paludibacteraceae bacterium]|nr:50S ribosomal protein L10 [Candidatus Physcocola equi]MCQ2234797.1 50S ribosomal protein L10 [Paludibacteraceae bacterium]